MTRDCDHAHDMLLGFARDLDTDQSDKERAAKSMGQGERTHRDTAATFRLAWNDDEIMLTINNQGSSIPADKIAIIFDPFVRIAGDVNAAPADEADHPERTSLGIGLFISREIIQAHGGRIAVASTTAEGTTFTITMPRQPTSRAGDDSGHVSGARDSGARTRPAT